MIPVPVLFPRTIAAGLPLAALLVAVSLAGCDQSPVADERDPALDDTLRARLTWNGQRPLSNFMLPESDDYAAIPQDPNNPLTAEKVTLGRLLFHDPALATSPVHESAFGTYSCATCHHAEAGFQAGRRQAIGDGGRGWGTVGEGRRIDGSYTVDEIDVQPVRSPSILNVAYQRLMAWNGQFGSRYLNENTEAQWMPGTPPEVNHLGYDGVESQAIAALTIHRMDDVDRWPIADDPTYAALWQAAFPGEEITLERVGLAIAAYERTVLSNRAPFQQWLRGDEEAMTDHQKRGAILYFGKADCEQCHTGAPLSSMAFYALGMPDMVGADVLVPDSDGLGRGGFTGDPEEEFEFKVPQVYNLVDSPFMGHGGNFTSVREVVEYYNDGMPDRTLPHGRLNDRFRPLHLTVEEVDQLTAFIAEALRDPDLDRYVPGSVPSGGCIPANDAQARVDLGC